MYKRIFLQLVSISLRKPIWASWAASCFFRVNVNFIPYKSSFQFADFSKAHLITQCSHAYICGLIRSLLLSTVSFLINSVDNSKRVVLTGSILRLGRMFLQRRSFLLQELVCSIIVLLSCYARVNDCFLFYKTFFTLRISTKRIPKSLLLDDTQ